MNRAQQAWHRARTLSWWSLSLSLSLSSRAPVGWVTLWPRQTHTCVCPLPDALGLGPPEDREEGPPDSQALSGQHRALRTAPADYPHPEGETEAHGGEGGLAQGHMCSFPVEGQLLVTPASPSPKEKPAQPEKEQGPHAAWEKATLGHT